MKRTYHPSVVRRKRTTGFLLQKTRKAAAGFNHLAAPSETLASSLVQSLKEGAQELLRQGRPTYLYDASYPDAVVCKYPDGRKELVKMTHGKVTVIRTL